MSKEPETVDDQAQHAAEKREHHEELSRRQAWEWTMHRPQGQAVIADILRQTGVWPVPAPPIVAVPGQPVDPIDSARYVGQQDVGRGILEELIAHCPAALCEMTEQEITSRHLADREADEE